MRGFGHRLEHGNFRTEVRIFFTMKVIKRNRGPQRVGFSILGDIQDLLDKVLSNLIQLDLL